MAQTKKKSSPGTRERLLQTALDIFGSHGFESATTRIIANEAKVNISAIPYYFGGKQGLYQAVIQFIVEHVQQRSHNALAQIAQASFEGESGRHQAVNLMRSLVRLFVEFITGSDEGPRFSRVIVREQMSPSSCYSMLYTGFLEPIVNAFACLIMAATGEPSTRRARMRAMTVMGQILIFRVARETAIRVIDLEGYSQEEIEQIKDVVMEHTMAILGVPEESASQEP